MISLEPNSSICISWWVEASFRFRKLPFHSFSGSLSISHPPVIRAKEVVLLGHFPDCILVVWWLIMGSNTSFIIIYLIISLTCKVSWCPPMTGGFESMMPSRVSVIEVFQKSVGDALILDRLYHYPIICNKGSLLISILEEFEVAWFPLISQNDSFTYYFFKWFVNRVGREIKLGVQN